MSSTNGMVLQTGNYQPFSYDELVKPIDNMTKMQMAQEDAINKLEQQSSTLDKYVNDKDTPYASALYDKIKLNLKQQADNLARYGLTPETRQNVADLTTQYTSDIVPIATAQAKKQEQVKNYMDNQNKTPGYITSYDPSKISLDDFILHPDKMYESSDTNTTRKIAQETAAAYQKQFRGMSKSSLMSFMLYWERLEKNGATSQEILKACNEDPNAPSWAKRIIRDTMQMSGVLNWGNQEAFDKTLSAVKDGLWSAIGDTRVVDLENKDEEDKRARARAAKEEKVKVPNPQASITYSESTIGQADSIAIDYEKTISGLNIASYVMKNGKGKKWDFSDSNLAPNLDQLPEICSVVGFAVPKQLMPAATDTTKDRAAKSYQIALQAGLIDKNGLITQKGSDACRSYFAQKKQAYGQGIIVPTFDPETQQVVYTKRVGQLNTQDINGPWALANAMEKNRDISIKQSGAIRHYDPVLNMTDGAQRQLTHVVNKLNQDGFEEYDPITMEPAKGLGRVDAIPADKVLGYAYKTHPTTKFSGWFAVVLDDKNIKHYYRVKHMTSANDMALDNQISKSDWLEKVSGDCYQKAQTTGTFRGHDVKYWKNLNLYYHVQKIEAIKNKAKNIYATDKIQLPKVKDTEDDSANID